MHSLCTVVTLEKRLHVTGAEKVSGRNGTAAVFMRGMAILLRSVLPALGHAVSSVGRVVSDDA